ncbi:ATP-binding protein [Paractinoplanes atraurantiacus]|uniref:Anti-sigma regulatory factor (Ser/Thr protein kinase) n=1 Tax=Paractinoplanes atraurantiacus TaxID=1036182 RepID=A0A285KKD4_9ACTN|nr:ATP-binding protein [Actinoplanes atraurantiacus]SNY71866.1 Anti-sigma regulatory factor (Ser/Thr protein kinase) [Actinoplanes atraurantiacus]
MNAEPATAPYEASYDEPGDLAPLRDFVRLHATALGLPGSRADLLTLAVSELATNTLQHTEGGGRVRLWAADGRVYCDVIDGGPVRAFGRGMPAADALRGRGLAIVERICDEVGVEAGAEGTRVRLALDLKEP